MKRLLCRWLLGHKWKSRPHDRVTAEMLRGLPMRLVICKRCGNFEP